MSLAVALEGRDGVVLAADSRGTIGDPRGLTAINDAQRKLFELSKYAGLATFGSGEIGAELARMIQEATEGELAEAHIDQVEGLTWQLARENYDRWFGRFEVGDRPVVGLLVGGLRDDGSARCVLLVSRLDFAPQPAAAGFMAGGTPQYATYLVHRFYDQQRSVGELANLAEYVIAETASQDPKVGGPIRIATITAQEGYKELAEKEVQDIRERNERQSEALKRSFYQREGGT